MLLMSKGSVFPGKKRYYSKHCVIHIQNHQPFFLAPIKTLPENNNSRFAVFFKNNMSLFLGPFMKTILPHTSQVIMPCQLMPGRQVRGLPSAPVVFAGKLGHKGQVL